MTGKGPVERLERKGYKPVLAPESLVHAAEQYGVQTPAKVLSSDELAGRAVMEPTPDALATVDFVWRQLEEVRLTNGKAKPPGQTEVGKPTRQLVADDQGVMRLRVRKTQVSIYMQLPGEVPSLYEMGLPVVETGDKWHVNVGQKVPLNRDRDNVCPAYLQAVRVAVLNAAFDLLTDDETPAGWCKLADADPRCSDNAIKHLIRLR